MPIRNYPFLVIRPGDLARPYLPVTIINPDTQKKVKVYALIDTGADECAFPASFAPLLGHNLQAGHLKKRPLNYIEKSSNCHSCESRNPVILNSSGFPFTRE